MRVAFFLGSGASVSFGRPTTLMLRDKLVGPSSDLLSEIFQTFLQSPDLEDIEYVYQSVRDIRRFAESLGGKYFFRKGENGIFTYKNGQLPFSTFIVQLQKVEEMLERIVYENYQWDHDFDKELGLYDLFFGLLKSQKEIDIFTTNYDRAIETYAITRRDRFRLFDGFNRSPADSEFSTWGNFFRDSLTSQDARIQIRLVKLHGSLNWKEHKTIGVVRTNEESKPLDKNFVRNIVIMPTLMPKYEEDVEPFRTLKSNFREWLLINDVCIVIGFSFRDSLNEIFEQFMTKGKALIIISPTAIADFFKKVEKLAGTEQQIKNMILDLRHDSYYYAERRIEGKVSHLYIIDQKLEPKTASRITDTLYGILQELQKS